MTEMSSCTRFRRHFLNAIICFHIRVKDFIAILMLALLLSYAYFIWNAESSSSEIIPVISGEAKLSQKGVPVDSMDVIRSLVSESTDKNETIIAGVLVICATRANAITNHLEQLLRLRPSVKSFPIVVSQDGSDASVREVVLGKVKSTEGLSYINHLREPTKKSKNYQYIAQHYKWALDKMFNELAFDYVIITEDDLDISADFFSYFSWGRHLLQNDSSIWCISAWNDNGLPNLIDKGRADLLWRTDFFPGLGWMLSKELWAELSDKFPTVYWDDWMRQGDIRKNRSCVRPEWSRTSHNMKVAGKGTSGGMYRSFLTSIGHSTNVVDFTLLPWQGYVQSSYDLRLKQMIEESKVVELTAIDSFECDATHSHRISFSTVREWIALAVKFGLMTDIRSGMPRTSYHGIVTTLHKGCRFFIVPSTVNLADLKSFVYDPSWDLMYRYLEFAKMYCKSTRYTGKCDPKSPELIAWFKRKGWSKRLAGFGEMIVN